jgi:hypothetical protein
MPRAALDTDLQRVLDVEVAIREAPAARRRPGRARPAPTALLLQSEVVCFNDFDPAATITCVDQDCLDSTVGTTVSAAPNPDNAFFRYYWA